MPPDTNGDIGPNNYVQWVNLHFEIWNRAGTVLMGPAPGNTLWSGFGGNCEFTNQGDPVVRHDAMADRWVFTQFAFVVRNGAPAAPFSQCFAVSTTSDPTGSYYRYEFVLSNTYFNDYPKLGIWPDAYYMSVNDFNGNTFAGGAALAFDRASMLSGQAARMISFGPLGPAYGGMLPSDLDGSILPTAGEPDYFGAVDTSVAPSGSTFQIWKFHVDWITPANSTFGTTLHAPNFALTVATYNWFLCNGSRNCVTQKGTNVGVDAISDRLMNRLQYRRFSDGHESLVANHTVRIGTGNQAGIRWYEIRNLSSTPTVFQQGTYAPTTDNRWMGSIAMDQAGDIALGYSVSSSTVFPSIEYTGRLSTDTPGLLPQGEATLIAGGGSQTSGFSRWGDYSMMAVDPVDDCTFWYTQEYYQTTSSEGWQTRVGTFKFSACPPPTGPPAAPTGLTASPVSSSQINLSWTEGAGATSYKVERSPDGTTFSQIATISSPTFGDAGLNPGTTYYYRVRASNSFGDSGYSNVASATTYLATIQSPQGNWVGTYGANGYALFGWNGSSDLVSLPAASLVVDQGSHYRWTNSTTDVRALQSPDGTSRTAAALYHATQVRLHLTFASAYGGNLHLYLVDWDSTSRRETVNIDDGAGPRTAGLSSSFNQGLWINLPINVAAGGTLTVTVTLNAGVNAVLSGLFLGDASSNVPAPPTGLSASPVSQSQINLSWTGSPGATTYKVDRSPDGTTFTQIGTSGTTSFSDMGLNPSTAYYYRVRASNSIGDSGPSNVASATTYFATSQSPQGNWVGTYGANGYALFAWNGSSDLVSLPLASLLLDQGSRYRWTSSTTDVRALQSPDGTLRTAAAVYHATQVRLHLTFTNAYSGNLHLYVVDWDATTRRETITIDDGSGPRTAGLSTSFNQGAWFNLAINVAASGSLTITVTANAGPNAVLSGLFLGDAASAVPAAPTGLSASPVSQSQINLSWTGSPGATLYKVERSPDGTTFAQIATSASTSYSDTGLNASTTYYYRVRASNSFGDSGPSNVASATTYLATSQSPEGTWVGTYGTNGYALFGWSGSSDLVSLPLASLVLDQGSRYRWASSTTDVRALQSPDGTSRTAAAIYHATQVRLHLTFANAYSGNLHLYAVDWDSTNRRETITIDDGSGPRSAGLSSSFNQGAWINLPINVAAGGTVTITVTANAGPNAVLSGLFLD